MKLPHPLPHLFQHIGPGARIMMIISLHILIIGINGYITYYATQIMRMDAKLINYGGIVRGSIQKIVKLESNDIPATEDIRNVDAIIDTFLNVEKRQIESKEMGAFLEEFEALARQWQSLKKSIERYRADPAPDARKRMILESEKCWQTANSSVAMAQTLSEEKLSIFRILFFIFFLDFLLMVLIIWIINSIVRQKLEKNALYDSLTGICNRRVFEETLKEELERSRRYGSEFSLIIFDIDRFKQINDTYGHDTGDAVLKQISQRVKGALRASDLFCRIGGEEFAVIAVQSDLQATHQLAEKIRTLVEAFDFGKVGTVTLSAGVAAWRREETREQLYKRADEALYRAKTGGRNRVN